MYLMAVSSILESFRPALFNKTQFCGCFLASIFLALAFLQPLSNALFAFSWSQFSSFSPTPAKYASFAANPASCSSSVYEAAFVFLYKQSFSSLKCTLAIGCTLSALNLAIHSSKLCSGMLNVKSDVITSSSFFLSTSLHLFTLSLSSFSESRMNSRFSRFTASILTSNASMAATFLSATATALSAPCCVSRSLIRSSYSLSLWLNTNTLVSSLSLSAVSSNTSFLMKLWLAISDQYTRSLSIISTATMAGFVWRISH